MAHGQSAEVVADGDRPVGARPPVYAEKRSSGNDRAERPGGCFPVPRRKSRFRGASVLQTPTRKPRTRKRRTIMPSHVKPIPEGHRTVTPYLAIKNAAKALEFYKRAFGATEVYKLMVPDGRLGHAEIRLGDSLIMLADEFPEYGGQAPEALGGSPVSIHLYVEDVDAFVKKAVAAGAKERKPVMDQFYGD